MEKIKNGLSNVKMKFRFKVREVPVHRPLFLKVVGTNLVEIDTDKCAKQLTEEEVVVVIKRICPDAVLV